ncbi:MAG: MarR family transcriptional regulator, partial [Pseudomonadales bacterium]
DLKGERAIAVSSPLGKIVDQLETRGLLERRSDPDDRRINRLYLTEAVQPLIEPARQVAIELEQAILSAVDSGDPILMLDQLTRRLHELLKNELYTPVS